MTIPDTPATVAARADIDQLFADRPQIAEVSYTWIDFDPRFQRQYRSASIWVRCCRADTRPQILTRARFRAHTGAFNLQLRHQRNDRNTTTPTTPTTPTD